MVTPYSSSHCICLRSHRDLSSKLFLPPHVFKKCEGKLAFQSQFQSPKPLAAVYSDGGKFKAKGKRGNSVKPNVFSEAESGSVEETYNSVEDKQFVRWFREAWPYLWAHRGSTFVVIISGEIMSSPSLDSILKASAY